MIQRGTLERNRFRELVLALWERLEQELSSVKLRMARLGRGGDLTPPRQLL